MRIRRGRKAFSGAEELRPALVQVSASRSAKRVSCVTTMLVKSESWCLSRKWSHRDKRHDAVVVGSSMRTISGCTACAADALRPWRGWTARSVDHIFCADQVSATGPRSLPLDLVRLRPPRSRKGKATFSPTLSESNNAPVLEDHGDVLMNGPQTSSLSPGDLLTFDANLNRSLA